MQRFSSTTEALSHRATKAKGATLVATPTPATPCSLSTSLSRTTTSSRCLGTRVRLTTTATRAVTTAAVLLSNRAPTITTSNSNSKTVVSTTPRASLGETSRTARARRRLVRRKTPRRDTSSAACAENVQTRLIGAVAAGASKEIGAAEEVTSRAVPTARATAMDITRTTTP